MEIVDVGPEGIIAQVPGYGPRVLMAVPTLPTAGTPGFAHDCLLILVGGASSAQCIYRNAGSPTSCNFTALFSSGLQTHSIPLTNLRVWDALQTNLPGTAAADDLGLITGTFLTAAPYLRTIDFVSSNTTAYGRFQFSVPSSYVAGQPITLTLNASCGGIPNSGGTVDAFVVKTSAPTVDLCTTSAQSYTDVATDYNFTILPTNVSPGDLLDIRVMLNGTEDSGIGNWIATINSIKLKFTTRQAA